MQEIVSPLLFLKATGYPAILENIDHSTTNLTVNKLTLISFYHLNDFYLCRLINKNLYSFN
jgi:hypothetical protein